MGNVQTVISDEVHAELVKICKLKRMYVRDQIRLLIEDFVAREIQKGNNRGAEPGRDGEKSTFQV